MTGGTGFVGAAVARSALEAGHHVRVLVRPSSDRRNLEGLPVEIREGDLLDPASLEAALNGCRYLFHVAAEYRLWHPHPRTLFAVNVDGTLNALRAAHGAGVDRVVYTSSVATLGLRSDGEPADEETPIDEAEVIGPYKQSKFFAEREALRFADVQGLDLVVVNPSTPVGPGDRKPTPTGRLVLDAAAGRTPAYVDTGLNLVHVDDVARGHLLALERGEGGRRYVLGGRNLSLEQILSEIAALTGRPPPRFKLRPGWLLPLGYAAQAWARVAHTGEPRLTVDGLRLARKRMYFSDARARAELGYHSRDPIKGLRDAVAWFREEGYLR